MKAQVRLISKLLNQEPKKNGTQAWNWLGTTHSGKKLSFTTMNIIYSGMVTL